MNQGLVGGVIVWVAIIGWINYNQSKTFSDVECRSMEVTTRFTPATVQVEKTGDSYIVSEPAKVTVYRCVRD